MGIQISTNSSVPSKGQKLNTWIPACTGMMTLYIAAHDCMDAGGRATQEAKAEGAAPTMCE
jgi:hypothetical protein